MSPADVQAVLPEIWVAATALVVLGVDLFLRDSRQRALLVAIALVGLAGSASSILAFPDATTAFGGTFTRDAVTNALQLLTLAVAALAVLLSRDYLARTGLEAGEYYTLLLLASLGAMLMAAAGDLLLLFIALETLSLPLYVLAGYARTSRRSQEAGMKYFLLGSFASALFLYGVALVYGHTVSTKFAVIARAETGVLLQLGVGLIIVGLGFKAAAAPFHAWAPDVYEGAPMPATAFMSVVAKIGAFAALLRFLMFAAPLLAISWRPLIEVLAAVTILVGNLAALRQVSVKRMLAYSSVAHAGYLLMGVAAGSPGGLWGTTYYLFVYALMNLGAFAVLLFLTRDGAEADQVADLGGLSDRSPFLAASFALFMASLAGLPPTPGFLAKFYLFTASIQVGSLWLAIVGVLGSVISIAYYMRAAYAAYGGPTAADVTVARAPWAAAGLAVAVAVILFFAVLPGPLTAWAQQTAALLR
ncbi:MAG: NADH-quinone oxidoreductase subunit N [Armatimonadetes bacterium]|nr:NADH-quinone oxidoreductase subunit N [Armatimonadota bacterium]